MKYFSKSFSYYQQRSKSLTKLLAAISLGSSLRGIFFPHGEVFLSRDKVIYYLKWQKKKNGVLSVHPKLKDIYPSWHMTS